METTFNFIEKNLFTYGNNHIYFSVSHPPEILLSRVDEIFSKYIGDLKLFYSSGEEQTLKDFLTHNLTNEGRIKTNKHFGLEHVLYSQTFKNSKINAWRKLQNGLRDPDKVFDKWEHDYIEVIDRRKTKERMEKSFEELDQQMPELYASLNLLGVTMPINPPDKNKLSTIGEIYIEKATAMHQGTIDFIKSELIKVLRRTQGYSLSYDTPDIFRQVEFLSRNFMYNECNFLMEEPKVSINRFFQQNFSLNH